MVVSGNHCGFKFNHETHLVYTDIQLVIVQSVEDEGCENIFRGSCTVARLAGTGCGSV